jgi:hypothetical protein
MQESFLHYIWQFQYFERSELRTTTNEPIQVFHPGYRNSNSGPDFSQARIKIGHIEWIGNVEIHIYSSGWTEHNHHADRAYDNVILHVVWDEDQLILRNDRSPLPTLKLNGRVSEKLLLRYKKLLADKSPIHCASVISTINPIKILSMKERALLTRLEIRNETIKDMLRLNRGDWEETCYQLLARNFGFRVNAEPFTQLVRNLPYRFIRKHSDKLTQIEALLFGQAGLLEKEHVDQYYNLLKREYRLMVAKFALAEAKLNAFQWKFLRLRPANFPTIRIAQFAALLCKEKQLFTRLINAENYNSLVEILEVEQSDYWKHHYLFTKFIKTPIAPLGKMSIDNIIINTAVPMMVAYAKSRGDEGALQKSVSILQSVDPEENSIVKMWSAIGVDLSSAFDTQASLELYHSFCSKKRCLECVIGSSLFGPAE